MLQIHLYRVNSHGFFLFFCAVISKLRFIIVSKMSDFILLISILLQWPLFMCQARAFASDIGL